MPGNSKPFLWMEANTATNKAGMLVTILPSTDAETGNDTATKFINLESKAYAWAAVSDFNKPGRPGKATDPASAGASALALGAASALVVASLF